MLILIIKNDQQVLNNINLSLPVKNDSISWTGGAGKSTILSLIPRFYNVNNGDIKIDNQSIYNLTLYSLRKTSLVSQETTLFDDTIRNNIAYANLDASEINKRSC